MRDTPPLRIHGNKPSVLVLMGGPDAERAVSLESGAEVALALRQGGEFEVADIAVDRPTIFELQTVADACKADVVFPVLHGPWGEGGALQVLLEQLGLPYVGSQPESAAKAMDKLRTKALVSAEGVATPPSQELEHPQMLCVLKPPIVLKPVDDGSSVDLRICRTDSEVEHARQELHARRGRLMAETYIHGRELTAGIALDQSLPLIEIVPAVEFYDYQAKYSRGDTRYIMNPELPEGVTERCIECAMIAYRTLGCRDVARVDFMLEGDIPQFLEINTMPGFTTHSLVPMAAGTFGWNMPELCTRLVQGALDRPSQAMHASRPAHRHAHDRR